MASQFDVIVLGGGPAGYVCAIRAAQLGLATAVVEREKLGGVCVNIGCIPTKALLHSAYIARLLKESAEFGVETGAVKTDYGVAMKRSRKVADQNSRGVDFLMKKHKITVVKGTGVLQPGRKVKVGSDVLEARKAVVIATGSRVKGIPQIGLEINKTTVISSDEALVLEKLPASVAVIGAGAVGMEFASLFARFGTAVTVIEMLPRVLPLEDEEVSAEAQKVLAKQMAIHVGAKTEAALKTEHGVEVGFRTAQGESKTVTAELLLLAVGRGPVTDGLNLESTKAQLDRGHVRTNHLMATDEPGVFAIGDVVALPDRPHPQLAHVASAEGIGVMERLAGKSTEPVNYDQIPSATYCRPETAGVGLTEAEARKRGHDVRVGRFPFAALAKPRILGHTEGFVKVVSDARYDEVLGIHMVGPHVTDLVSEACLALRLEATTEEIFRTIHPHPTLPETLMQAAEAVYGHAIDA